MFPLPRRDVLRIGGLGLSGLGLSGLVGGLAGTGHAAPEERGERHCIFMLLQGGLSHLESWDPKPEAVPEIRGPFRTIGTAVPGLRFGELTGRSAAIADRLCVVRSMTHEFTNHIAGTYVTLTGNTNQPDRDREAHGDDFPGPGAVLNHLAARRPSRGASVPRSVALPNWLSIPGPSNRMPGQFAGFLGAVHDPFLVEGDPSKEGYRPLSLSLPDGVDGPRIGSRLELMRKLDNAARLLEADLVRRHDHLRAAAYEMVVSGKVRRALDLDEEPPALRDRYGRNRLGQSLLLARRLVEAGVRFVGFNEFNQKWDTHGGLKGRYERIVPEMEAGFAALVEDLADRGLLDRTLVVNTGEFGRTPKMNGGNGRDHWPNVYSTVLAGGGVRGGSVHGASDSQGAEVLSNPTSPADVLATMWGHLGVDPRTELRDRLERPMPVSEGRVLTEILA